MRIYILGGSRPQAQTTGAANCRMTLCHVDMAKRSQAQGSGCIYHGSRTL